ncbi:hypothetical protein AQUCO_00100139v1 [Aquilegia coerulea]|uniref:Rx N-terminal domain-containing protein n=1 Tax=Aquilegia coerulea TaxID=218851 RepID=A0A2G5F8W0_AQUCA|nr:hypothetical protein AQUCO_00100139v1 [Aquilegia coerulea]
MADALISLVLEQSTLFLQQKVKLVVGAPKEIESLNRQLVTMRDLLRDAEKKQINEDALKSWLENLKDIVYSADDVLDEWNTKIYQSQLQEIEDDAVQLGIGKKLLSYISWPLYCCRSAVMQYDIGSKLKVIREDLKELAGSTDIIRPLQNQINQQAEPADHQNQTSSISNGAIMYGRDEEKKKIMSMLLAGDTGHQQEQTFVPIIAIVGTVGLGKTTLAKSLLIEAAVEQTFEKKMWVSVGKPCNLLGVVKAIIEETKEIVPMFPTVNEWQGLLRCLCNCLQGKRYLLVLDNVCTEVQKFEKIGRQIVEKCNGVPKVVRTLATIMHLKRSKQDWIQVLRSEISEIPEIDEDFFPTVAMSYNTLSSELKQCLLYCAIFPKEMKLYKDELVKLWMAQGYLGSSRKKELENTGGYYFNVLAMRFFKDLTYDSDGNVISCKMSGFMHDFAQNLANKECSIMETNGKYIDHMKVRHILTRGFLDQSICEAKKLRTLLLKPTESHSWTFGIPVELFLKLTCLRALDMSNSQLKELPREVDKLLHLRYLDLSRTELAELPETICNLYNLQTLKLNECRKLQKLPQGIGKLAQLRHLELQETDRLNSLPLGVGKLKVLRTLSKFIVTIGGCDIRKLKDLQHLNGNLKIDGLGLVGDADQAAEAGLEKKHLHGLTLSFGNVEERDVGMMMKVLGALEPIDDLEELKISGYPSSQFPDWIVSSSRSEHLLTLVLSNCENCAELPALGKLASLEKLELGGMRLVKHIGPLFYGFDSASGHGAKMVAFPKLKKLEFSAMKQWEEWDLPISEDTKIMPSLCELSLSDCPKLRALPNLGKLAFLENLMISGLSSVKQLGFEFLGISDEDDDTCTERVRRGVLKKQQGLFSKVRALPFFGKLGTCISNFHSVKCLGLGFLGTAETKDNGGLPVQEVRFPSLKKLMLSKMEEWEEWNLPLEKDRVIMPCLGQLELVSCPKLRAIPDLAKFDSLKSLSLRNLDSVEEWEEQDMFISKKYLHQLTIVSCPRLNGIPGCMFSHALRNLYIDDCPKLKRTRSL